MLVLLVMGTLRDTRRIVKDGVSATRRPFSIYVLHLQVAYENRMRVSNTDISNGNVFDQELCFAPVFFSDTGCFNV